MFFAGLDLGQAADYTALSIFEQFKEPGKDSHYHCVQLFRFPLRMPYHEIVQDVQRILSLPELVKSSKLVVDATGVGAPVVDLLMAANLNPIPIMIVSGASFSLTAQGVYHVPKVELVSNFQVLLQSGRVAFAQKLPDVQTLLTEMTTFQVRVTRAANEVFGAFREGTHDDLVLASALPLWYAEKIDAMFWTMPMAS